MTYFKKNKSFILFILVSLIILVLPSLLGADAIFARPGGGHSYSGGGSGGGGGDGIGGLIILILAELPPEISIPLIILIIVGKILLDRRRKKNAGLVTSTPTAKVRQSNLAEIDYKVDKLKSEDPNFSIVLFLDFASSVFTKYYSWFGKKEFKDIAPYLTTGELNKSKEIKVKQEISEIVIGSINISDIQDYENIVGIAVDIDANFTATVNGKSTRYIVTERWYFNRKKGVLSQEPDKIRKLACPNCGANPNFTDAGECEHCGTHIKNGEMQWYVKTHSILSQQVYKTSGLVHYAPEAGTNLQTIYQRNLNTYSNNFANSNGVDINAWRSEFTNQVVSEYFIKIYNAWSINDLLSVRNLLTDRQYESFMFWIDSYKREGLINKLENIKISNIQLVRIDTDKFYESVTVRIYTSSMDYVVDNIGKVKGGSSKRPRAFSEYWTFIRKSGVKTNSYDFSTCPNCGAPADKMGQAGVCEYCGTKISNGDFSWVLAIITQDEAYSG